MADLDRLLDEFAADYEAGRDVDPASLLDRAGDRRQELAARIDSYLMTAPPRRWDRDAYERSLAKVAVDRVYESIVGVSGTWPELLPALRNEARIKRADLVNRLARALGFADPPQIERVGDFYNQMEHGRLRPGGISDRVIDALAEVLGTDPERIRAASGEGGGGAAEAAFARTAFPNVEFKTEDAAAPPARAAGEEGLAEVDALFLDG